MLDLILTNEEGMVRNLDHLPGLGSSDHVVLKFTLVCYAVVVSSAPPYRNITDYRHGVGGQLQVLQITYKPGPGGLHQEKKFLFQEKHIHEPKGSAVEEKKEDAVDCRTRNILDHARFTKCLNELRSMTRKLRREHERKLATDLKQNPKAFWKYANTRLRTRTRVEDLNDENGGVATTNQSKADMLSNLFSSVFTLEAPGVLPTLPACFENTMLEDVDVSPQIVEAKLKAGCPEANKLAWP